MARFVAPRDQLDTRELPDQRLELLAPLWYESDLLGGRVVKIPTGFVSDLESVPRWLPLAYALFARTANRAGVVHDALYQRHKVDTMEVPRRLADAVYWEANALDQSSGWRRWVKWAGVRLAAGRAYRTGPQRFQVNGNDQRRQREACAVERRTRPPMSPEERRQLMDRLRRLQPPETR